MTNREIASHDDGRLQSKSDPRATGRDQNGRARARNANDAHGSPTAPRTEQKTDAARVKGTQQEGLRGQADAMQKRSKVIMHQPSVARFVLKLCQMREVYAFMDRVSYAHAQHGYVLYVKISRSGHLEVGSVRSSPTWRRLSRAHLFASAASRGYISHKKHGAGSHVRDVYV